MHKLGESEIFSDYHRTKSVEALRSTLQLPPAAIPDDQSFINPLSIGIEIEENWRQALPALSEKWVGKKPLSLRYLFERPGFTRDYRAADTALREVLEAITPAIPASPDSYHEFSFYPAKNLNYTVAEINALFEAGLLRDNQNYALHMTVSGFERLYDAYSFLTAQELLGATTPKRLLGAITARQGSWSQKGNGGIKVRRPDELVGDDTTGHELRTLCVTSQEQLISLLGNAARLAMLYTTSLTDWKDVQQQSTDILSHAGLPFKPWQNPKHDPSLWQRYADVIDSHPKFEIH